MSSRISDMHTISKLNDEVYELRAKLNKLQAFISKDSNKALVDETSWKLMCEQSSVMEKYTSILDKRMQHLMDTMD